MRRGRLVMYCANVLFGCVVIDALLGQNEIAVVGRHPVIVSATGGQ